MQTTLRLNSDLAVKINHVLTRTSFHTVQEFVIAAVEEKLQQLGMAEKDPIDLAMGFLKHRNGGTATFLADKELEIEKELGLSYADAFFIAQAILKSAACVTIDHREFDPLEKANEAAFYWLR